MFYVDAFYELKGDLVGLCGYFDGIKSNDWLTRDEVVIRNSDPDRWWYIEAPSSFSDSWEVW